MSVDWFLSTQGRLARIGVGTALILIGLGVIGGVFGVLLLIIGAIPIASAAYGTFLLGPLFGRDIRGRRPEDQRKEAREGEGDDASAEAEDRGDGPEAEDRGDERGDDDSPAPQPPDEEFKLARAERPPGQGPRTKEPRAEDGDQGASGG